ncbi:predicted protein [Sclerotinia sclerotiorum 1980 UF-70]|uniref:Uncharacterized protein n=1 Tax=Sclerotinia sclerotiorum (strain ATCC 18683 / 1980 / Ss-1) TaxID=665079 RepID=A7E455_SCLS1|nr:predicted protein [Sclerotinia sclerotiorum 1980 UF-70]EDN90677.1 predicted protein [Sclerotinia sclerotiorum 1980 UF-70]
MIANDESTRSWRSYGRRKNNLSQGLKPSCRRFGQASLYGGYQPTIKFLITKTSGYVAHSAEGL